MKRSRLLWFTLAFFSPTVILACKATSGPTEKPKDKDEAIDPQAFKRPDEACLEDNPLPVRLVRLAHSEILSHLESVLGHDVVTGEGAPVFYLQGDHTNPADERNINSVDFASYRGAARVLAHRYVRTLPATHACLHKDLQQACTHGPLNALIRGLFRGNLDADGWTQIAITYCRLSDVYSADEALEAVVAGSLLAPQVIYRTESGDVGERNARLPRMSPQEALESISFAVLGRAPEAGDRKAIAKASDTNQTLAALARRWTQDDAFGQRMSDFVEEWLGVAHLKEKLVRPDHRGDMSEVLLQEFRQFVRDNLLGETGNFARLFTHNETRYFPGVEDIYRDDTILPDRVIWDERKRKGVLGLAGLLAAHANAEHSDPVQRGMLVRLRLLCEPMPPPIPNADFTKVGVTKEMQTRERFETLAHAPSCRSCHLVINPPGYLFETFDQFGRYRETEFGRPINARGGVPPFFGQKPYPGLGDWSGITQLADWISQMPQARLCFAREFSNYFLASRVFDSTEGCAIKRIARRFVKTGRVPDLVEDLVASDVFHYRALPKEVGPTGYETKTSSTNP